MNAKLANLGQKSRAMMRRAGITQDQLRRLGAVRAYVLVKRKVANASLNLLWALEGALTKRSWQEVARTERLSLLLQVEQLISIDSLRSNSRSSGRAVPRTRSAATRRSRRPQVLYKWRRRLSNITIRYAPVSEDVIRLYDLCI